MALKLSENKENIKFISFFCNQSLVHTFYTLSITLLSLILPLSFLLLARLSSAQYLISVAQITPPKTFLYSIFLHTNPNLLHVVILLLTLASLVHALTARIGLITESPGPIFRPRVHAAWIFLCTLQVCVGLGIEATIEVGVDGVGFGGGRSMLSKFVFFLGLHETMVHWARTIVRPVVDDTVYGEAREEKWFEKWALAGCFGALAWWRLRDEVESLVVLVEVKREMMMKVGLGDFTGLFLYYLTVAIGMSRILKGLMWFFINFFGSRIVDDQDSDFQLEDKV